jgi:multiple sugar transport system permease protein
MQLRRLTSPYLLILPSFFLAAFIILWPLKELGEIATHEVNRFGQLRDFAGLDNFRALFGDADFIASAWRTLVWTVAVVGGALLVSAPVALILNGDFYGRGLARVIIMLPWAVSLTMTAIVWRWALSGESGMLNSALRGVGAMDSNIQWLAAASTAFPMQILIGIVATIPFTVTIFLGGLSSVPDDLYEAASIEGASAWDQFRLITLSPAEAVHQHRARFEHDLRVQLVPIIWAMTQGGPANSTDILVTYLYKLAFRWGKLGEASARFAPHVRPALGFHRHLCAARHAGGGSGMSKARRTVISWLLLAPLVVVSCSLSR